MAKKKERFPKDAVSNTEIKPEYGMIFNGFFFPDGAQTWTYTNPKDHKKTHSQEVKATGSFKATHGHDEDKEYNLELKVGEHRGYTAGGHAHHSDGSTDSFSESTYRNESQGDKGDVCQNRFRGTKGKIVDAGGPSHKHRGGSSAVDRITGTDSVIQTYEQDHHSHVQGNIVTMGEKNKVDLVQKDYAMNAGQNWDTYIKEKGKIETGGDFKLTSGAKIEETAKNEYTMSSDQKIVIKVGQSKITIESGEIKIEGAKVTVKADGQVDIKGAATMIQGGGQVAPPTTFK